MLKWVAIIIGLLLPSVSVAQNAIRIPVCGSANPSSGSSSGYHDAAGNFCVSIEPPQLTGQGTLTATGTSAIFSTANITPTGSGPAFPATYLPGGYMAVKVQGSAAASVAVCWLGGTCTFATGEVIQVGESVTRSVGRTFGASPPSIISQTGSVVVSVEW